MSTEAEHDFQKSSLPFVSEFHQQALVGTVNKGWCIEKLPHYLPCTLEIDALLINWPAFSNRQRAQ